MGPRTNLHPNPKLSDISGKPTGQGYGAARKGPEVQGPIQDAVVNEEYQQPKDFATELKPVPNIFVK